MKCNIRKISPTALNTFENDSQRFVLTYVLDRPRMPQTPAMAVGSSFDAHVKAAMIFDLIPRDSEWIHGENIFTSEEEFRHHLLVNQVEKGVYDIAVKAGKDAFDRYVSSTAYKRLIEEMRDCADLSTICAEFDTALHLDCTGILVPIGGKPDWAFLTKDRAMMVIYDWKVNGYYSNATTLSKYLRLLLEDGSNKGPHRDAYPITMPNGLQYVPGSRVKPDWTTQLVMYSWSAAGRLGVPIDTPTLLGVEQLAFSNSKTSGARTFCSCVYRLKPTEDDLEGVKKRLGHMWECIQAEHYFHKESKETSDAKVEMLATADSDLLRMLRDN